MQLNHINISSEIVVCRPGSNPLGGLRGGSLTKNQLFTIWFMQQHVVCQKAQPLPLH